jgi:hypothetical protein
MRPADWRDVVVVLTAFTLPPGGIWVWAVLRQRHLDRLEAEAMAAEGYPPPGPPTTDSLPDAKRPPT